MSSRKLNANGLAMHIEEQGDGPLVLLIHGFPETAYAWRHQLAALAASGFHAVAPDMRGYGETQSPSDSARYSTFDLVGDLVGLLDALNRDKAIIVGNDWGSTIAWQAALMRPDKVRGVVAIGVPMMGAPPAPPTSLFPQTDEALSYILYFQEPGVAEAELERDVAATLRKILFSASRQAGPRREGDGTPNPFGMVSRQHGLLAPLADPTTLPDWLSEADLAHFSASFRRSGFRGGLNYYRNLDANWQLQRSLLGRMVEVPALYMVGEQDAGLSIPGMRQIIDAMPALVPHLRRSLTIPDCGHWAPQEKPREVSEAIIAFARSLQDP
ncbi:alpha/beta hydrolase [Rhizobium sp. SSA_523]|uniref:alpha/beta fold hydrolase n=1 Tax=Rhizobium sp. SSA_523 TaxID=2952477 RepID=UPI002091DA41|nr:alpha/beta hydrolase [Rhizobium sp. SSA_523]MCO5733640.1 alpha/beta hydrolase [Rhizobium sp. SSA_523]WKC23064.1 alpha/beta hydrolase [Rhizobium sp. SSA_523]